MRRERRRPMYFFTLALKDGTVLASWPERKPSSSGKGRYRPWIDDDNVCRESLTTGDNICDVHNEGRTRFQDIIATNLNTRRAIRTLVLPQLAEMRQELVKMRAQLDRIERQVGAVGATGRPAETHVLDGAPPIDGTPAPGGPATLGTRRGCRVSPRIATVIPMRTPEPTIPMMPPAGRSAPTSSLIGTAATRLSE